MSCRALVAFGAVVGLAAAAQAATVTVGDVVGLSSAVNNAQPGDVITLLDGNYMLGTPLVAAAVGSASAPIRVAAAHAHAAVLVTGAQAAVQVTGPFWIFDGIDVAGGTYGLQLSGAGSDAVVGDAHFSDQSVAAVRADCGGPDSMPHCDRGQLASLEITRAATVAGCSWSGVELVGAQAWQLRGLSVHDVAVDPLGCAGVTTVYGVNVRDNSSAITIDSVAITSTAVGLALGPGANDCAARSVVLTGAGTDCTIPSTCAASSTLVSNAVVYGTSFAGMVLDFPCSVMVHAATLWNDGGASPLSIQTFGSGSAELSDVIFNVAPLLATSVTPSGGGNLMLPTSADTSWFIDAAHGNFRLLASAPAVDHGVTLTDVPRDFDGVTRPQGSAYDVGAFERPQTGYTDGGLPVLDGGSEGDGGSGNGGGGSTSGGTGVPGGGSQTQPPKSGCQLGLGSGGGAGAIGLLLALLLVMMVRRRA